MLTQKKKSFANAETKTNVQLNKNWLTEIINYKATVQTKNKKKQILAALGCFLKHTLTV